VKDELVLTIGYGCFPGISKSV